MTGTWRYSDPAWGRLEIDTTRMSDVLWAAGQGPVNHLARRGAAVALRQSSPADKRLIGIKPAKRFALKSKSRRMGTLTPNLDIPVALIFNNSKWAAQKEIGSIARPGATPPRPLLTAFNTLKSERGVQGIREKDSGLMSMVKFTNRSRASRRRRGAR